MPPDGRDARRRDATVAAPPDGWEQLRRVLAVRLDNVGDVVMLGPALRALRRELPGVHLTLMCSPAGSHVAPLIPEIDDTIVERVSWQDASGSMALDPARELALVERLRGGCFDAAIIFTSFSQTPWPAAYACALAGIPIRVGRSKEFGGSLLTHIAPSLPDDTHQVDRNLSLLRAVGFTAADGALALTIPADALTDADALLRRKGIDPGDRYAVVAPGASCKARRYPADRFAAVVESLRSGGLPVVLVGHERELALAELVLPAGNPEGRRSPVASIVGQTDIATLTAVIGGARLLIANDSGPMHIADALGTPQVVLFSGTDYESQWRPRTSPAVLLREPTPCSPCYLFDCPIGLPCLDIAPERVVEVALGLIDGTDPQGPPSWRNHPTDATLADPHLARPRELPVLPLAGRP